MVDVQEAAQFVEAPSSLGCGQRLGAPRAMKSRRRSIYDPPTFDVDLDRPPEAVTQVEIKLSLVTCDTQVDGSFLAVKQGFRFEKLQRYADCSRAGALARFPVVGSQQEQLELAGADRMILPMAIDANGGPAVLVRIMKELDSSVE